MATQPLTRPLLVGNWKMQGLSSQLADIQALADALRTRPTQAEVLICPPATLIERAAKAADCVFAIGGQTCHHAPNGAFTGELSAEMLRDAGATAVIVGHSERRQQQGETDAIVAAQARAALRAGLLPLICVGETLAQHAAGQSMAVCGEQLAHSVPQDVAGAALVIAYEPLWAIGSGHLPSADEITAMHAHLRQCLLARLGLAGAAVRILYGGSVTPGNARALLALPEVAGALVGAASLRVADFEAIVRSTDQRKQPA